MASLLQVIKSAAVDAGEAAGPCGIVFGSVLSASPLKVQIDQKLVLTEPFLILTSAVKDHEVDMTVDHATAESGARSHSHLVTTTNSTGNTDTDSEPTHVHSYNGTKKFTVKNGLKAGEPVILLRMQGGQKYIILDRG